MGLGHEGTTEAGSMSLVAAWKRGGTIEISTVDFQPLSLCCLLSSPSSIWAEMKKGGEYGGFHGRLNAPLNIVLLQPLNIKGDVEILQQNHFPIQYPLSNV